jgi:hypothetical protein
MQLSGLEEEDEDEEAVDSLRVGSGTICRCLGDLGTVYSRVSQVEANTIAEDVDQRPIQ